MEQGSPINPYQAPESDIGDAPRFVAAGAPLASRASRLVAAIIDGVVQLAVIIPLQLALGVYENFPNIRPLGVLPTLAWSLVGVAVYLAFNGYLLHQNAQTIGKRLLGIRIVNQDDGEKAPFGKLLLLRILPIQLAAIIPVVGNIALLIDDLFIFGKAQRCLHDRIAGTDVVQVLR